jgi:hypothetical protein
MCHERYWQQRREETEESKRVRMEFEGADPVAEPEPVRTEPEREREPADAPEEVVTA